MYTLSEIKNLYDYFDGNRDKVIKFIQSVNDGYISIDGYEDADFYDGTYFDPEEWVRTYHGNIISIHDARWCENTEEWWEEEDGHLVYDGRDQEWWSQRAMDREGVSIYNGEYYSNNGLEYHDIVWCEDIDEYMHVDEAYYDDDRGYWVSEEPSAGYVRSYHNGGYTTKTWSKKPRYYIGYEIEKEDEDVRNSIEIDEFENQTDNIWRKESDGSLDSCSGFELVSPTFELNTKKIFDYIRSNELLVKHIDASKSYSCGGHINLSEEGLTGEQMFDKIKGYTPLLYALYHGRVDKNYCKGKSNKDLKEDNEKYQAIKIHSNRIEFRIISAVPNVETLEWRTKLIKKMLDYPTNDIKTAFFYVETKFKSLLKQTYKTEEKLNELHNRFVKYSLEFENINPK